MNLAQPHISDETCQAAVEIAVNGTRVVCDFRGVAYLPDADVLIVSDLHLEKGAAFARRGQLHPPYDTTKTLKLLTDCVSHYQPKTVISLGDSFHDRLGEQHLSPIFRSIISELQINREWIWILGNHDPEPFKEIDGLCVDEFYIENLIFRHEPDLNSEPGEVAGHLHPAARIRRRGKSVKRTCFATDGTRLIMPAFGATTGGLSLSHKAFSGLFDQSQLYAHVMGKDRIYPIAASRMIG